MSSMFDTFMRSRTEPDRQQKQNQERYKSMSQKGLLERTRTQHSQIADMGSALKKVRKSKVGLPHSYVSATTTSPYK